jgi:hypothetical protein
MRQNSNFNFKSAITFPFALALVLSVGFGCGGMNNPFRDYSSKPFKSQQWRAGDAIERGRMLRDLYKNRGVISGKSKESVLETLGEPDKKSEVAGQEVWQYAVKFSGQSATNYFSVSFKDNKSAVVGNS